MWRVWLVLSMLCGRTYTWLGDAECITADGSEGRCIEPSDCAPSYQGVKPVLCRYSRGYGTRICCPRQLERSYHYDGEPISFPSESPYVPPISSSYNSNPYYIEDSGYLYTARPPYNRPQNHEKPSYESQSNPSFGYDERPSSINGRPHSYDEDRPYNGGRPNTYNERPTTYNEDRPYNGGRPNIYNEDRPYNGGRPNTYNEDRPYNGGRPNTYDEDKPYNGRRPTYNEDRPYSQERPNSFTEKPSRNQGRPVTQTVPRKTTTSRPQPGVWQTSDSFDPQNKPGRRTTLRPIWAVENDREPNSNSNKRMSEIKCEEYSQPVTQTIGALPLSFDAEAVTVRFQKCDFTAIKLIVGGEAADLGEYPHMAALGYRSYGSQDLQWNCGGTLISDRYVVTAGHCANTTHGNPIVVRLGEYNLARDNDGANPEDYGVEKMIVHPQYFKSQKYNDIALVRLSRSVRFNKWIRPACLPKDDTIRGKPAATGWGRTDYVGKLSDILMKVNLNVIDNQQCNSFYKTNNPSTSSFNKGIVDTMLCAGEIQGGRDTCFGDSGGPLTVTKTDNPCIHYLIGITSFGKICGAPYSPGVYTRVSKYLSWIERTVW